MAKKKAAAKAAPAEKVNKTEWVRAYAKEHPQAKNKDILAAAAEQGIVLRAPQVSTALNKGKPGVRAAKKADHAEKVSVQSAITPAGKAAAISGLLRAFRGDSVAAIQAVEIVAAMNGEKPKF